MIKYAVFCFLFFCKISVTYSIDSFSGYPYVSFKLKSTPPTTVFYGETLRIPIQMDFINLWKNKLWHLSDGIYLENVSGYCPSIPFDQATYWGGSCTMNIVIPGTILGKTIAGGLIYDLLGQERHDGHLYHWERSLPTPEFYVTVVPHPLSMLPIPLQQATANLNFSYNLKSIVKYYDENEKAGKRVEAVVIPIEQGGLRFDSKTFSIIGTPNRLGVYTFRVSAQNTNGVTEPTDLKIEVKADSKDRPVFKKKYSLASALPNQKYMINLRELLEAQKGFMVTNQVTFRIQPHVNNPTWLTIPSDDATRLIGTTPDDLAGKEINITLIASSNTGGDSEPLTIRIPIAYDPSKTPVIDYFELEQLVGTELFVDLTSYVSNADSDSSLRIILDEVEPKAPWLRISELNPTVLEGIPPDDATGQKYELTLRANTLSGGASEYKKVPLQISINKSYTPLFKRANSFLPLVYPGQSFFYDFVANRDVIPEYELFPYEIMFAQGHSHPDWLSIENNQLKASIVPNIKDALIYIYVVIKNRPGGTSETMPLVLQVMN